jgi:hypothetical protein
MQRNDSLGQQAVVSGAGFNFAQAPECALHVHPFVTDGRAQRKHSQGVDVRPMSCQAVRGQAAGSGPPAPTDGVHWRRASDRAQPIDHGSIRARSLELQQWRRRLSGRASGPGRHQIGPDCLAGDNDQATENDEPRSPAQSGSKNNGKHGGPRCFVSGIHGASGRCRRLAMKNRQVRRGQTRLRFCPLPTTPRWSDERSATAYGNSRQSKAQQGEGRRLRSRVRVRTGPDLRGIEDVDIPGS